MDFLLGFFVYLGSKIGWFTIYINDISTAIANSDDVLKNTRLGNIIYTVYTFEPTEEAGLMGHSDGYLAARRWLESLHLEHFLMSSLPTYKELFSVLGIFDIIIGLAHGVGFLNTLNGN